ncbi:CaiB/BaiF CoA transferase family protein, partial [Thermodesulfobacteriota bacterium]
SENRPDGSRMLSVTLAVRYEGKDESLLFNTLNLNKLDITLNLSNPKAVALAKDVAKLCDIVVENFRPGVMKALDLDYETIKKVKPDVIYLSSSSRGSTGPERSYAGYAPMFAALGGISSITGRADSLPSSMTGSTDLIVGTSGFFAVMAALMYRSKTGKGQYIDLSSSEAVSVLTGDALMEYAINQRNMQRKGNSDFTMAPHGCYPCSGERKWISIAVGSDLEWKAFCDAIGNPDLINDERFSDESSRRANEEDLNILISEWTRKHTHYEAMEILQNAGVAAMPSLNVKELFSNPHLMERSAYAEVDHPVSGIQTVLDSPWKLSATPSIIIRHAPLFGEHSEYVFGQLLGLSDEKIEELKQEKVIY